MQRLVPLSLSHPKIKPESPSRLRQTAVLGLFTVFLLSCLSLTVSLAAQPSGTPSPTSKLRLAPQDGIEGEYLVLLADFTEPTEADVKREADDLVSRYGGTVRRYWHLAAPAFLAEMNEDQALALAKDPSVRTVEQNRALSLFGTLPPDCYGNTTQASEVGGEAVGTQAISCSELDPRDPNYNCPDNWGLDRIDQALLPRDGFFDYPASGAGTHVYLIDSGIASSHPEFAGRLGPSVNVTVAPGHPNRFNLTDCLGHGTHTAAIAAGSTFGVAKDAVIHMVKVSDPCGDPPVGTSSQTIINAIDWILSVHGSAGHEGPAVVNYSGGNTSTGWSTLIATAAQNLLSAGISLVQSAGNQNDNAGGTPVDACSRSLGGPVDEVIVVGGMDLNRVGGQLKDGRWLREGPATTGGDPDPSYPQLCGVQQDCGSNTGSCIDIWAPAAHIQSADHDGPGASCRLSGTSMAAPHVAGAVALHLEANPTATPAQVHQAIVDNAILGVLEDDPLSPYSIGNSPNRLLNVVPGSVVPPNAGDDTYVVPQGSSSFTLGFNGLFANDTPVGEIRYNSHTQPQHGNIQIHAGGLIFQPFPSFWTAGSTTFTYTIELLDLPAYTATATVTLIADPVLFEDDFESGSLSSWDSQTVSGGATLQITPAAAFSGNLGLAATLSSASSKAKLETFTPSQEDSYSVAFWLNADSLTMAPADFLKLLNARDDSASRFVFQIELRQRQGPALRLRSQDAADQVTHSTLQSISGWTHVEVQWGTGGGQDPGFVRLLLDGSPVVQQSGIDFGSRRIDRTLFGAFGGNHPGTSGTVYLDEFVSQR